MVGGGMDEVGWASAWEVYHRDQGEDAGGDEGVVDMGSWVPSFWGQIGPLEGAKSVADDGARGD